MYWIYQKIYILSVSSQSSLLEKLITLLQSRGVGLESETNFRTKFEIVSDNWD